VTWARSHGFGRQRVRGGRFPLVGALLLLTVGSAAALASGFVPGTQLWVDRSPTASSFWSDVKTAGTQVYVTGLANDDYATAAYDAATGTQLWQSSYDGPAHGQDGANALAVSPDGSRVYVGGTSKGAGSVDDFDYAVVAYDTASGAELWVARYDGPAHNRDFITAVGVSPDGSRVFVTGASSSDSFTAAYGAETGTLIWGDRYAGPAGLASGANALAVAPDEAHVYVTGSSTDRVHRGGAVTVSYAAGTGAREWVRRYISTNDLNTAGLSVAVSPDGMHVFVGGTTTHQGNPYPPSLNTYLTVAYDAATGSKLWVQRYSASGQGTFFSRALAVNPNGTAVYITGGSSIAPGKYGYATVAYESASGKRLWVAQYEGGGTAYAIAVRADGTQVYVTGPSPHPGGTTSDWATVAYGALHGEQLWAALYDGPGSLQDVAGALATNPDGSRIFASGLSRDPADTYEATIVAYATN